LTVTVEIPIPLRIYTKNDAEVKVEASTVEEALSKLDGIYPSLKSFIVDEKNDQRRYVNIFINQTDIRSASGLRTMLKDGDRLLIIPAVAGGT